MHNRSLIQAAFAVPVLVLSSMAFACGGGPDGGLATLPGMGIIFFHIGLLLPILAGVLERPFFTLAGMDTNLLFLSIWLNGLASLVMNVLGLFSLLAFGGGAEETIALMTFVVAGGAGLKYYWLRKRITLKGPFVSFAHVLAGSIASAAVIALLPLLRQWIAPWSYSGYYIRTVQSYQALIILGTIGLSLLVYYIAFLQTRNIRPARVAEQRGFEVVLHPASTA